MTPSLSDKRRVLAHSIVLDRRQAYWLCQITGWGGINAIKLVLIGFETTFTVAVLANPVLHATLGIGLTHAFRAYVKCQDWMQLPLRALIPRVLGGTLMLSVLFFALFFALCQYTPVEGLVPGNRSPWTIPYLISAFLNTVIFLTLWSTFYFGLRSFWKYQRAEVDKWKLEARAETARLEALKLQLNPHFFFNSLNSVRALIARDPERAQSMVTRLAHLLRRTLLAGDEKMVPLQEELSTARTYLELEKIRLKDRLHYKINVEDGLEETIVPHLLVQTLTENAIKHGIAKQPGGGTLTITARQADEELCLQLTNPGTLDSTDGGVGLDNTRERLRLLFEETADLTIREETGTVTATVRIPIHTEQSSSHPQPSSLQSPSSPHQLSGSST